MEEYFEMQFIFYMVMAGVTGLMVGSFLNVCIYRLPRGRSIVAPGSACPECGHPLAWWENIPLLSWAILRGRCRSCKIRISPRYFLVELLSGAAACLLFWEFGGNLVQFIYYYIFFCLLVIVFFIDLEHWIIPDSINLTGVIAGVIGGFFIPVGFSKPVPFFFPEGGLSSIGGAVAGYIFFGMIAVTASLLLRQEAMGYGDVKFAAMIGAFLGFSVKLPVGFILAFLIGGLFSIPFLLIGRKRSKEPIPFGTFMAIGAFIALLWGDKLFNWYKNLSGGVF